MDAVMVGISENADIWEHTDPELGIGFSECQKGSEGSLEFCEQYENRIWKNWNLSFSRFFLN